MSRVRSGQIQGLGAGKLGAIEQSCAGVLEGRVATDRKRSRQTRELLLREQTRRADKKNRQLYQGARSRCRRPKDLRPQCVSVVVRFAGVIRWMSWRRLIGCGFMPIPASTGKSLPPSPRSKYLKRLFSVVITKLHNQQFARHDLIHHAVLACDSARPATLKRVPEWLRLPNASPRIAERILNQMVNAATEARISFLPIQVIVPTLRRKSDVHSSSSIFLRSTLPRLIDSSEANSRLALAGERSKCAVS